MSVGAGARTHYAFDSGSTATCVEYDKQLKGLADATALRDSNAIHELRKRHTKEGAFDREAFDADLKFAKESGAKVEDILALRDAHTTEEGIFDETKFDADLKFAKESDVRAKDFLALRKAHTTTQGALDSVAFDADMQIVRESGVDAKHILTLRPAHTHDGNFDKARFNIDLSDLKAARDAVVTKAQRDLAEGLVACAESGAARKRVLSFAAAMAWRFPSSQAEKGDLVSHAYWVTFSQKLGSWTVLGLGKLRFDQADRVWDGVVDLGARAIFSRKDYAAALEVIARLGDDMTDPKYPIRAALQVEYMIDKGTWLSVSFGKDFGTGDGGKLFSLANLTTSFGDPKLH
jgi:hypothetical protein